MKTESIDLRVEGEGAPEHLLTGVTGGSRRQRTRLLAPAFAGALLLLVANATAVASPKALVKSAAYKGTNSERGPVTFEVSKNGRRIQAFTTELGYNGKCGQGGGPGYEIKVASIAIGDGGKFAASTKGRFPGAGVKPVTVKIKGRIVGARASGSVREPGNTCATPHKGTLPYSETFTATAA